MEKLDLSIVMPKVLKNVLIPQENGDGYYKYFGGYWELMYLLFKKYAPAEFKQYEDKLKNLSGDEFVNFNERVRSLMDSGDEQENWINAQEYFNQRMQYYSKFDIHYIEDEENDITIGYRPNGEEIQTRENI